LLLAFGTVLVACGKKDSGGGAASGRAAPASDFTYDLTEDGEGVIIKAYTGNGGKVVIPAKIEGFPVVELGTWSFYGETNAGMIAPGSTITSVVIPESVKKIGGSAFSGCGELTSVTIQGTGVALNGIVFKNCIELSELVIPDGDNVLIPLHGNYGIYTSAFEGCKKLPLAMRSRLKAMGFTDI
jgi:hypothetical protein